MNEREFDEISRFLTMVGQATLFEYLEVSSEASSAEVEQAIKNRRSWAQGQQANPKYRGEALWVIKNVRLMRKAMVEFRQVYLDRVQAREEERGLEVLTLFIRGTLASGTLTEAGEAAIVAQGRKLGLPDAVVRARIQALAREHDVPAPGGHPTPPDDDFQDHYAVLEVPPDASAEDIDHAYRAKYRWARTLADTRRSRDEYARLDAALRDLKDPERRAAYDERYRARNPEPHPTGREPQELPEVFLPPPPDELTHPSAGEPSVPSVSMGTGGPRLAPARTDHRELTQPPGASPPVHAEPPPRGFSAPPGTPAVTAPPGTPPPVLSRTSPPGTPVPPSPERITGKTLTLGAQREGTRLELASPAQISLTVGRRVETARIQLKQVGAGTVTGRVLADRDWVTVDPSRLEAGRTHHTVLARVHPERMPKQRGSSVVTIVPSHGPRLSVTLDVEQKRSSRGLLVAVVLLVLAALAGAAFVGTRLAGQTVEGPARVLQVDPDPPTAMVFVGDKLQGPGSRTITGPALPEGPVTLKVTLDGFDDYVETLEVPGGAPVVVRPKLALSKPLTFVPTDGQDGVELDAAQVREQLATSRVVLDPCFSGQLEAPESLRLRAFVGFGGQVEGLLPLEPTELDPAFLACVARGLRSMTFVLGAPGDYWYFETTLKAPAGG